VTTVFKGKGSVRVREKKEDIGDDDDLGYENGVYCSDESFITATEEQTCSHNANGCENNQVKDIEDNKRDSKNELARTGTVRGKLIGSDCPTYEQEMSDYRSIAFNDPLRTRTDPNFALDSSTQARFGNQAQASADSKRRFGNIEGEEREQKIRVPIYVCLIIITGYILAGSVLFTYWEGWDIMTGSYFCFVTLSTIGFGDIVPGTDMSKWDSTVKLVLCALWLALGLSVLAMCFNLMQEEVKETCKRIALKCGLIKDETEE